MTYPYYKSEMLMQQEDEHKVSQEIIRYENKVLVKASFHLILIVDVLSKNSCLAFLWFMLKIVSIWDPDQ